MCTVFDFKNCNFCSYLISFWKHFFLNFLILIFLSSRPAELPWNQWKRLIQRQWWWAVEVAEKDSKTRANRFTQTRRCLSDPGACAASRTRRQDKTCSKMKPSVTDVDSVHNPSVHPYDLYIFIPTNYYYVLFLSNASKISDRPRHKRYL